MKGFPRKLFCLILACLVLTACGGDPSPTGAEPTTASNSTLPTLVLTSDTAKTEVTVKAFVDGDTVHFYAPGNSFPDDVLKARFLAIDTPESTGKVEPYGKAASRYTEQALTGAVSILVESDTSQWNLDSTGSRYLCWIWYKTAEDQPYRNLNLELLEIGLAAGSNPGGNRYGESCLAAIETAKQDKRNLHSGEPDPEFTYDGPTEVTLKELRTDPKSFEGQKVSVVGTVIGNSGSNGVYLEAVDEESGIPYGFYVYYGHNLPAPALDALRVGNLSRIVGTVQFYEGSQSWQIAGLSYNWADPEDISNPKKLEEGHFPAYTPTDGEALLGTTPEGLSYSDCMLCTSIQVRGLTVASVAFQENSQWVLLTCQNGGVTLTVCIPATAAETGEPISEDQLLGKKLDVKGIVTRSGDAIQIQVIQPDNLTIY